MDILENGMREAREAVRAALAKRDPFQFITARLGASVETPFGFIVTDETELQQGKE